MLERWGGMGVVECDVGGCLVVVSHGCYSGFDRFVVLVVGVVVSAVECGEYVH